MYVNKKEQPLAWQGPFAAHWRSASSRAGRNAERVVRRQAVSLPVAGSPAPEHSGAHGSDADILSRRWQPPGPPQPGAQMSQSVMAGILRQTAVSAMFHASQWNLSFCAARSGKTRHMLWFHPAQGVAPARIAGTRIPAIISPVPPTRIEAVLWDNDGVLVNSEIVFFEATRRAFARLGLELTRGEWGRRYFVEARRSSEIALLLGADPAQVDRVIQERNREYRRMLHHPPAVRPRVRETLAALSKQVRLGIATGCHRDQLRLMHEGSGLLDFFEVIVTGDDCSSAKPHPEAYLKALQALGADPARCLAVGDSPRGLASALAAGIRCVVVPSEVAAVPDFPGALLIAGDVSAVGLLLRNGGQA